MKQINSAFDVTQSIISEKWKSIILYYLRSEKRRTRDLLKICKGVSHKVLNEQLNQLVEDGLITRAVDTNGSLIKVEYSLTTYGMSFIPLIKEMCYMGEEHSKIKGESFDTDGSCPFGHKY